MFQKKFKLLMLIIVLASSFTNVKHVLSAYIPESYNSDDASGGDKQAGKQEVPFRDKLSWSEEDETDKDMSNKFAPESKKEIENIEHTQPLKRSDDPFLTTITNSSGESVLLGLNSSSPCSKYHCPVNLLYGNNLTVKNYFLVLPRCNMTPDEVMEQMKKEEYSESKLLNVSLNPVASTSNPNEIGSILYSNKLLTSGSTEEGKTTSRTSATAAASSTSTKVEKSEDKTTTSTSNPPGTDEGTKRTKPPDEASTSDMRLTTGSTQTSDSSTATPKLAVNSEVAPGVSPGASSTVLDKDHFMRTVDRYCETFNMSDVRTYTIHPVSIAQTMQNDDAQLDGSKSHYQGSLIGSKQYKRHLANKHPRKQCKRHLANKHPRKHVKRFSNKEVRKE